MCIPTACPTWRCGLDSPYAGAPCEGMTFKSSRSVQPRIALPAFGQGSSHEVSGSAASFALHCLPFEQGSSHKVSGSEASCASDKPVRYRLCRSLVHALRRLRSVQFMFKLLLPFSFLAKPFSVAAGFLPVPWWNSLGLVLCARVFRP